MARITETEIRRKLKKGGSGGSSGPTATRKGDTWEYSEAVLYLAYAVSLTNATDAGIIANQSDAVGFQLTPFNASGMLLPFRGHMFSKSIYQSGDPTDYTWESVDVANSNASFIRYYSTFSGLLNEIGNPEYPGIMLSGSPVPWISLVVTAPIPATAYFVAEQYTINNVKSKWKVYPVNVDDTGFGLITYNVTTHLKPELNTTQWDIDVVAAVIAFTGRSYSSVKEIGYGTAVVITYSDGKQTGIYKKNAAGIGVWSTPTSFIDGDLLVNGSINTDKITANSITAGKLVISGPNAVLPGTIGAASSFELITAVGTLNTAISNAQGSADGKITSYYQDDAPTVSLAEGDFWTDTDDGNKLYRYDETTAAWVNIADSDIARAIADAAGAQGTADGKVTTYLQDAQPTNGEEGDLWIDTNDDNNMHRYNALTTNWVSTRDGTIAQAIADASTAQSTADGKINTYFQDAEPTGMVATDVGDLWVDTNDNNNQWRYDGAVWVDIVDGKIAIAVADAATAQGTADGKVTTFYQDAQPTAEADGDLWIDTNDGNKLYRWSATTSTWSTIQDSSIADALAVANSKVNTYYQDEPPTGMHSTNDIGDIWIDTNDGHNQWRYNGSAWVDVQDTGIAQAISDAAGAQGTADGKVSTHYQTSPPTGMVATDVGDLWVDTNDSNKMYRYSGTTWVDIRDTDYTSRVLPDGVADAINNNTTTINGSKITTGTILAAQIAANAITASKIAAGTITSSKIANGTITTTHIAGGTITTSDISANAITSAKIAAGAITASELSVGAIVADRLDVGTLTANQTNFDISHRFTASGTWTVPDGVTKIIVTGCGGGGGGSRYIDDWSSSYCSQGYGGGGGGGILNRPFNVTPGLVFTITIGSGGAGFVGGGVGSGSNGGATTFSATGISATLGGGSGAGAGGTVSGVAGITGGSGVVSMGGAAFQMNDAICVSIPSPDSKQGYGLLGFGGEGAHGGTASAPIGFGGGGGGSGDWSNSRSGPGAAGILIFETIRGTHS